MISLINNKFTPLYTNVWVHKVKKNYKHKGISYIYREKVNGGFYYIRKSQNIFRGLGGVTLYISFISIKHNCVFTIYNCCALKEIKKKVATLVHRYIDAKR